MSEKTMGWILQVFMFLAKISSKNLIFFKLLSFGRAIYPILNQEKQTNFRGCFVGWFFLQNLMVRTHRLGLSKSWIYPPLRMLARHHQDDITFFGGESLKTFICYCYFALQFHEYSSSKPLMDAHPCTTPRFSRYTFKYHLYSVNLVQDWCSSDWIWSCFGSVLTEFLSQNKNKCGPSTENNH